MIPCYLRVPTCAYQIGECVLDRHGTLDIPETMARTDIERLLEHLSGCGFDGEREETADILSVSIPDDGFTEAALENLKRLIKNKSELFKKAFHTENTGVEITDGAIIFNWFPFTSEPDEVYAYTTFTEKLCDMAKRLKRVSDKVTETDNDKYAFRCFLLRLGFIGAEYKTARKVLLKNLTGNSAFRYID